MNRSGSFDSSKEDSFDDDLIILENERILNPYDEASDYAAETKTCSTEEMCERIKVNIVHETLHGMHLEFDLVHLDTPLANALRRVLIAEVPSMAVEKIYLYQNTSVIQDEVLCHRIGLLPIKVDPRRFEWPITKVVGVNENGVDCDEEPEADPSRELVFNINVKCTKNLNSPHGVTDPKQLYINSSVYTDSFKWIPCGNQAELFKKYPPRMVHDDILLAKMRPGQEIEASCHVVKGIGRDHAKFSPVATAFYRLLPTITLLEKITGEDAHLLKSCFSKGVVEITEINGEDVAVVINARIDSNSRNIFRYEHLSSKVRLGKKKDHFLFTIESTGALESGILFEEACKTLENKCDNMIDLLTAELNFSA